MGSLSGSIRAWDGRTRTSTDGHGRNGERVWYFARSSQPHRFHGIPIAGGVDERYYETVYSALRGKKAGRTGC